MTQTSGGAGGPPWPTLQEQLELARAVPGTAFAELIAANQDFSTLRPDEASDNLRLPPWLRVLYRGSHPAGVFSASDPSGGYPQYLWTSLEWMMLHQDLPVQKGPDSQEGR